MNNLYDILQTLKLERAKLGKEFHLCLLNKLTFAEKRERSNKIKKLEMRIERIEKHMRKLTTLTPELMDSMNDVFILTTL